MVTTCFLDTFWCGRDVSVNWSLDEEACSTFNSKIVFRVDWGMNIMTDVLSEYFPCCEKETIRINASKQFVYCHFLSCISYSSIGVKYGVLWSLSLLEQSLSS